MSDIGSPARRLGRARSAVLGLVSLGVLACAAWLAWREVHGAPGAPAAVVQVTPAAVQPAEIATPAFAPAPLPGGPVPPARSSTSAAAERQADAPGFDIVRVSPSGSAVVAGRAAPNAEVALLDNGREIGRSTADSSGQFVVVPDQPLHPGAQQLALQATPPGSTTPVIGDTPALVAVPERASAAAPGTMPPHAAAPGATVALLTPPDVAPRLLTVPSDGGGAPGQVVLRVVDYDAHGAIRFAGTARAGASVRIYIDNLPVGDAVADAEGRWGLVPAGAVAAGTHQLRADDLGAHGQVLSRAELPFQRAVFGPDTPQGGEVVVQPRQSLWRIARQVYGHGMRYTVIYGANRDQIRDPNRIYPGQVFTLPNTAAPDAAAGDSR